ncbi:hypothetical protein RJ639_008039 [Escallonia herrerae]|uniref:Retroviral polymerase SH3-like domain-containing protein n=1 Tax=Escallonia herrerae TaxID=1293975 RepID=A0AA88VYX0_9ASTE|nr:hypothetical protein RJ639_008039 [Escallonia herrerae]
MKLRIYHSYVKDVVPDSGKGNNSHPCNNKKPETQNDTTNDIPMVSTTYRLTSKGSTFEWEHWPKKVKERSKSLMDLYLPLVGEKPEVMNASEWAILDRKALATVPITTLSLWLLQKIKEPHYGITDDASRKTWIYAIKHKSDVYHTFKKWKALVDNETGNKFWAAAVDTAVYLINRSPASTLNGGIPEEEWLGKPVNYSFLRVFGCIAYAHIDKEERTKLDSKSHKCVFIGYGGDEYGYRLWDYEHNKIIRSRNVIFDESRLYKHRLQEHGIEKENKEYMELDKPEDGQIPRIESPEVLDETIDTEIGAGDQ